MEIFIGKQHFIGGDHGLKDFGILVNVKDNIRRIRIADTVLLYYAMRYAVWSATVAVGASAIWYVDTAQ